MSPEPPPPSVCPICGSARFTEHAGRPAARCERCGALERHRALARVHARRLTRGSGRRALEIGPLNPHVFGDHLRERGWRYTGVDGSRTGNPNDPRSVDFIDHEVDARELSPIADHVIALVLVQHVLEEIDDYERVLVQITRVLARDGTAILEIPFDAERPNSSRHPPDRFGNVWSFGVDLLDVVRAHFRQLEVIAYAEGGAHGHFLVCGQGADNRVADENALPGDSAWWGAPASTEAVAGYTSHPSVRPGDRLELHVSTHPAQRYRISIHRLGWYDGAGARTVTVHPGARSDLQGLGREPAPVGPGPRIGSAAWPVTDVIFVEDGWTTGVYVARLMLTTGDHAGESAYVPFVVRSPLGTPAPALVQQPVMTAQAHNSVDGVSLVATDPAHQALAVTLDRPLANGPDAGPETRWPFGFDYQLVRFLEREGVDVEYTTDIDSHREPWTVETHRLLVTSGAGADWTRELRDAFDRARDAAVSIACMAPVPRRRVRLEDADRTIVGCPDPSFEPLVADHGQPLRTTPSGGLVFAPDSPRFAWSLDDWGHPGQADAQHQRLMRAALGDLLA